MPDKMTQQQAAALAALLHELRPEWVTLSMMGLLRERNDGTHPYPDLVLASVRAATSKLIKNPGGIFQTGPHWADAAPETRPNRHIPCPDHRTENALNCRACRSEHITGMRPEHAIGQHWEIP